MNQSLEERHKSLREEWNSYFSILSSHEIADWWLSKLSQERKELRQELVEILKEIKDFNGDSDHAYELIYKLQESSLLENEAEGK